jgi:hypothetical protein
VRRCTLVARENLAAEIALDLEIELIENVERHLFAADQRLLQDDAVLRPYRDLPVGLLADLGARVLQQRDHHIVLAALDEGA